MANKFFQTMVYQLKDAFGRSVGMIYDNGTVLSSADTSEIEKNVDDIMHLCSETGRVVTCMGYTFVGAGMRHKPEFVAYVEGEDEDAKKFANILAVSLSGLKQFHDEKFDKTNFMRNIILDNILVGDIIVKARDLHVETNLPRVAFLVRSENDIDGSALDIIQNMFPDRERDFVIRIDDNDIALIKEVGLDTSTAELEEIAKSIMETLNSEAMISTAVGIGSVMDDIRNLAKSYRESHIAIEVGKVFDTEKPIVSYDNLGIGRLIYQLPTTLCELFLNEVFKKETLDVLDSETILTIQKFFENNLNVSETSRQLYVHRNTLVYRLDKVQKLTGLDLRVFDHAIVFKVAMMVKKYLESNPNKI